MKQRLLVIFSIIVFSFSAKAQYNVTFRVDMTGVTPSANGVSVAGNFQSALGQVDFNPGDNVLVKEGSSNIYSTTVNLPEGIYEYKFYNGSTLDDGENVPTANTYPGTSNRYTPVFSDTTLVAFLFSGSAPAGKELLEFSVNLQFFTPNDNGVFGRRFPNSCRICCQLDFWNYPHDRLHAFRCGADLYHPNLGASRYVSL